MNAISNDISNGEPSEDVILCLAESLYAACCIFCAQASISRGLQYIVAQPVCWTVWKSHISYQHWYYWLSNMCGNRIQIVHKFHNTDTNSMSLSGSVSIHIIYNGDVRCRELKYDSHTQLSTRCELNIWTIHTKVTDVNNIINPIMQWYKSVLSVWPQWAIVSSTFRSVVISNWN